MNSRGYLIFWVNFWIYYPKLYTLLCRLNRKEGAQFRPLFCLPFFFCAPSFFFFDLEGAFFWEPSFRPLFFYFTTVLALKACFSGIFSVFLLAPSFRPPFFFFQKRPLFSFSFWRALFFAPSFRPPFFFAPSFLGNLPLRLCGLKET